MVYKRCSQIKWETTLKYGFPKFSQKKQQSMLLAVILWTAMFFSLVGSTEVCFLGCFHVPSYSMVWAKISWGYKLIHYLQLKTQQLCKSQLDIQKGKNFKYTYIYIYMYIYIYILSIYIYIISYIYIIHPSIYLSVYLSIYLSIYYIYIYLYNINEAYMNSHTPSYFMVWNQNSWDYKFFHYLHLIVK